MMEFPLFQRIYNMEQILYPYPGQTQENHGIIHSADPSPSAAGEGERGVGGGTKGDSAAVRRGRPSTSARELNLTIFFSGPTFPKMSPRLVYNAEIWLGNCFFQTVETLINFELFR